MNKQIHKRTLSQLDQGGLDGLRDDFGILSFREKTAAAFRADPFARTDDVVQIVGSVDGVAVGSVFSLPLEVSVNGQVYRTAAGCEMTVVDKFRNTQYGLKLPVFRLGAMPEGFMIGASQSQMMIKVSEFIGSTIFLSPRFIMLFKSRSVVEMKLSGFLGKVAQFVVDVCLRCYWTFVRLIAAVRLRGCRIGVVLADDAKGILETADIIRADRHPCQEIHDERWIKWHLTQSFSDNGPLDLHLIRRNGQAVAFYMTKRRFYEQASHRGFKNVWLASIVEWGAMPGHEKDLKAAMLFAAASFGRDCDAVEVVATESSICRFLRHWMWRQVGESNFVFKAVVGSPLEKNEFVNERQNWRIRPAMGDNGMS